MITLSIHMRCTDSVVFVINTILPLVLHHFQVTADYWLAAGECLTLTLSLGVIPCEYRHK